MRVRIRVGAARLGDGVKVRDRVSVKVRMRVSVRVWVRVLGPPWTRAGGDDGEVRARVRARVG